MERNIKDLEMKYVEKESEDSRMFVKEIVLEKLNEGED
jgi:hypothetical protein